MGMIQVQNEKRNETFQFEHTVEGGLLNCTTGTLRGHTAFPFEHIKGGKPTSSTINFAVKWGKKKAAKLLRPFFYIDESSAEITGKTMTANTWKKIR